MAAVPETLPPYVPSDLNPSPRQSSLRERCALVVLNRLMDFDYAFGSPRLAIPVRGSLSYDCIEILARKAKERGELDLFYRFLGPSWIKGVEWKHGLKDLSEVQEVMKALPTGHMVQRLRLTLNAGCSPELIQCVVQSCPKIADLGLNFDSNAEPGTDRFRGDDLSALKEAKELKFLRLERCALDEDALNTLFSLELEELLFYECHFAGVEDSCWQGLSQLKLKSFGVSKLFDQPDRVRSIFANLNYGELKKLTCGGTPLDAETLGHIKGAPKLRAVRFESCELGADAMAILSTLPELKKAKLRKNPIDDAALAKLSSQNLWLLDLYSTRVSGPGLASLNLRNLGVLAIGDCGEIRDEHFSALRMPCLHELHLMSCTHLTGKFLETLSSANITHLNLSRSFAFDRQYFDNITRFSNLKTLSLNYGPFGDAEVKKLTVLDLDKLALLGCENLTDEGVLALCKRPPKWVDLSSNPQLSWSAIKALQTQTVVKLAGNYRA